MIILDHLGGLKRGRFWRNELPFEMEKLPNVLRDSLQVETPAFAERIQICCELALLPRDSSNYGLLGINYAPSIIGRQIEYYISYSPRLHGVLNDNLALKSDQVYKGITKAYAMAIAESMDALKDEFPIPAGTYLFDISAQAAIGSSRAVFSTLTCVLIRVLSLNPLVLSEDMVKQTIVDELNNPSFNVSWKNLRSK
jgi:hypothetical protein